MDAGYNELSQCFDVMRVEKKQCQHRRKHQKRHLHLTRHKNVRYVRCVMLYHSFTTYFIQLVAQSYTDDGFHNVTIRFDGNNSFFFFWISIHSIGQFGFFCVCETTFQSITIDPFDSTIVMLMRRYIVFRSGAPIKRRALKTVRLSFLSQWKVK